MSAREYPDNPVLVRVRRGGGVESRHRGAWVAVRGGRVIAARGDVEHAYFSRSTAKPLQAVAWIEQGAADRFGVPPEEIALAVASHNGEDEHARAAASLLARAGFTERDLRCGTHPSLDAATAAALAAARVPSSPLRHNCSGKHAAMLLLAAHLGDPPARYLDPDSGVQRAVRATVAEMCDLRPEEIGLAVDGCSAPTLALPLRSLALGLARLTNPEGLPEPRRRACERILSAVRAHPSMLAGRNRLDTAIVRGTRGRILPKVGAEGTYAVGVAGEACGLALKIDDGAARSVGPFLLSLLRSLGWIAPGELESLRPHADTALRNHAGLLVGEVEVVP